MEIGVTKACIYRDGRCHGVFSDGSGIILHSGGQYCTYFSPNGDITRQITSCLVSGTKSKVLKLLKLYNSSCFTPISIFPEDIYKITAKDQKVTSSTWINPGTIKIICNSSEIKTIKYNPSSNSISIIEQDSKGALKYKSIDNEVTIALNSNHILFKVSYMLLLPNRKPTWTENSSNRVRLVYEYVRLSHIYHINNYPGEWTPVVNILLTAAGSSQAPEACDEINVLLPCMPKGEIWGNDSVSPAVNLFSYYNQPLYFYWEPEASYYVTSSSTSTVLVHEDHSHLECNQEFFTHFRLDNTVKFTAQTVPVTVRGANYNLNKIVLSCKEFQNIPVVSKPVETETEELLDGIKFENEVEGLGSFIAYNDKSIRVLFEDRTLIRIYHDFTVSAISRTGEAAKFSLENPYGFEQYVPVCVEFYNWAFTSQSDQIKKMNETAERETIVMAEISRNERLHNRIPITENNIEESILNTRKQIEETKTMLNKLNKKSL
jgi:Domain of unknown function (DUF4520)/Domain of unknown function (DUF4524)